MKITILVENATGQSHHKLCASEWGFSAFIQTENANILFDTGHSDIYRRNAQNLDLDINSVDFIILSHHHWDHVEGLLYHDFKDKKKIILHPEIMKKAPQAVIDVLHKDFEIMETSQPLEFAPGCYFLGEIPTDIGYEKGDYKGGKMLDDTALAIKSKDGVVVITGCSHSGICNICEYAKKVTNQNLFAVMGGFHLFEKDQKGVDVAINYFKAEKPPYLYPMHCVDLPTMAKFYNEFGIKKLGAGDMIDFATGVGM